MSDPKTYGGEFYRMSFKEAIEKDILVDYKILAIGVRDDELAKKIKERAYVTNNSSLDEVANNYALDTIMENYSANHALTFHSRVKLAEQFSERHSSIVKTANSFKTGDLNPGR